VILSIYVDVMSPTQVYSELIYCVEGSSIGLDSFQVISNIAYSSNEQKQDIKLNCLQAHKFSMQFFLTKQRIIIILFMVTKLCGQRINCKRVHKKGEKTNNI
jgi:hypothetical protein